jgi:uncharacterized membrane protein
VEARRHRRARPRLRRRQARAQVRGARPRRLSLPATELLATRVGRVALAVIGVTALATVVGAALLWPAGDAAGFRSTSVGGVEGAKVTAVAGGDVCVVKGGPGCQQVQFEVTSGTQHQGERGTLVLGGAEGSPTVEPGDRIRVAALGAESAAGGGGLYTFIDFERRTPLLALAIAFVVLVLALGRMHGLRALLGLALSVAVLLVFVVPAIYSGEPALLVAIVGALAVMLVTIALSHGMGIKSAAAILGTAASLIVTALLAVAAVKLAHLTGTSIGEAGLLRGSTSSLSFEGLVLAGMVIGALGVLDDVTVSQSSTVLALHRTDPRLGLRTLVARALAVGRDHLGATVNTLALAYAGASLPLLLVFQARDAAVGDAINSEPVATAVGAAIVGSIGLILAVPLTTMLAAVLARSVPVEQLPDEYAHHH